MPPESAITTGLRNFSAFLHSRFFGIKFRFTPTVYLALGGRRRLEQSLRVVVMLISVILSVRGQNNMSAWILVSCHARKHALKSLHSSTKSSGDAFQGNENHTLERWRPAAKLAVFATASLRNRFQAASAASAAVRCCFREQRAASRIAQSTEQQNGKIPPESKVTAQ